MRAKSRNYASKPAVPSGSSASEGSYYEYYRQKAPAPHYDRQIEANIIKGINYLALKLRTKMEMTQEKGFGITDRVN
jgi:hypothetical protein